MVCLHQLFEVQVDVNGSSVAVVCEGRTLTYSELNTQANQLAHYLISKGSVSVPFLGFIDNVRGPSRPANKNPLFETKMFILHHKIPIFKTFNKSK